MAIVKQKPRKTSRIPLISGAYQARSIIASAQRSVNLYPESNQADPQAPVPVTHYPTPGSVLFGTDGTARKTRATYRSSVGIGYTVIGTNVYLVLSDGMLTPLGTIPDKQSQVYFADNGQIIVLVDGTEGWTIDMQTSQFAKIVDPSFYGADFVIYLDTFFVFNRPDTNQFYISLSNVDFGLMSGTALGTGTITNGGAGYTNGFWTDVPLTGGSGTGATADLTIAGGVITNVSIINPGKNYIIGNVLSVNPSSVGGAGAGFLWTMNTFALAFDPLDIAAKSGRPDPIIGISTTHAELWLIGALTTEVWIGTGAADFYFQRVQGAFIDHGCAAQYSISNQDLSAFWLMQDAQGDAIIVRGAAYQLKEISTPAIVADLKTYPTISDAIGFCFQQQDHAFYVITFPRANKTWAYELKNEQWHQWAWTDSNGILNRHRANCCMFVYGKNIIGDWEKGKLYSLEPYVFTDDDGPITRVRTFPHLINDGKRVNHIQFIIDLQVGSTDLISQQIILGDFNNDFNNDFNYIAEGYTKDITANVSLRWSDDRGATYGNPVIQSLGQGGEYLKQISYWRLGQARDRVYEVSWSSPVITALNGAFIEVDAAKT